MKIKGVVLVMGWKETADIVKRARKCKGLTQAEFGISIGRPQSVVSKYEKGIVEPPGHIVMHCMNILGGIKADVSPADIARLVKDKLSLADHAPIRIALANFIESIPSTKKRSRPLR